MIDPARLDRENLVGLDRDTIHADHDEHEPLELDDVAVAAGDAALLAGVPLSVDGCVFDGCDLSMFRFVSVRNSRFVSCKFRGTRFMRLVRNVRFERCRLDECVFRMITVRETTFADSSVADSDFYGSTLRSVGFPRSDLRGVGFDQCEIDDVDLSEAADLLIGDPRTLAGVSIDETQVPLIALRLAQLSGIDVRED